MGETKLKPCPFCGASARLIPSRPEQYIVACDGCFGLMGSMGKEEVINAWNRRADNG